MADGKKSIIVYADWMKKFEALSDEEAGKLIKHFFRYVNDLSPKAPDRVTELLFIDIEQSLKRDLVKWEKRAERSRENGKNGGRPPIDKNPEKPIQTQQVILEPRKPDSVSVNVSVTSKDVDDKEKIPSATFYTIHEFENSILDGTEFGLLCVRNGKKSLDQVKILFPIFIQEKKAESHLAWKTTADARKHFISWLKKQPSTEKTVAQRLTPYGQAAN